MSINANSNKYLGVGKRFIIPSVPHVPVTCPFANAQAQTYWNALTAANGGVEVNGALYGISTCALKTAIDNWFIATSSIVGLPVSYLYIGNTAATQAINANSPGLYDLTFAGGVTHTSQGAVFDGTGSADTGLIPSALYTSNSLTLIAKTISSTTGTLMSCIDGAGIGVNRISFTYSSLLGQLIGDLYRVNPGSCISSSRVQAIVGIDGFNIVTRNNNDLYLYQNATQINTVSGAYCGAIPVVATLAIGGSNNGSIITPSFIGTMAFNALDDIMSAVDILAYTTATETLMTILGR
jgi:hypothetical protein